MKLTSSARTLVAAMIRSPSFSRSSSSRITTISPAPTAATMSSIESSPDQAVSVVTRVTMFLQESQIDALVALSLHEPLQIAGQQVHLNINSRAGPVVADHGLLLRVRDDVDRKTRPAHGVHGQAHAVHGHGSLHRDVTRERRRYLDRDGQRTACGLHGHDLAAAVD